MRNLLIALIVGVACGGTAVVDGENDGSTGGNNTGGAGTGTTSANGGSGNTGATNTGGTGNVDPNCTRCNDFVMGGGFDLENLCPESQALLLDLFDCVCSEECPGECADSVCGMQGVPDDVCLDCLTSQCSAELTQCFADS